jgi:NTP pyrophosphatase (non-canonical NTP hydrolase)
MSEHAKIRDFGQRREFPGSWLNEFHRLNWQRCARDFAPAHEPMALVACIAEEVGELAGAVLGVTGEKKRKAHLTSADVLDGVADAMTYLSLLAWRMGCTDLQSLLGGTFNMVSDRAGSSIKVPE